MSDIFIKNIPHEQITTLASQVEVQAGQVVSKTLAQNDALSNLLFFLLIKVKKLERMALAEMRW